METLLNLHVADIVATLNPNLCEDFEERAAIMEFEANMDRAHAECLAAGRAAPPSLCTARTHRPACRAR